MEMIRKTYEAEVKSFDEKNLIVEHFISTESPDRVGDIVRAKGMQIRGKPVVLLQHGRTWSMDAEPIAKPLKFDKRAESKGVPGIVATTQFFPDETGKRLFEKNIGGYMPNWSIGFISRRSRPIIDEATQKETGREILDWELLEYSLVAVPAQPDAHTGRKDGVGEIKVKFYDPSVKRDEITCAKCGTVLVVDVDPEKGVGSYPECPECHPIEGLEVEVCDTLAALIETLGEDLPIIPDWRKDASDEEWTPQDAKPYPNEHACRVNDPAKYDRFRRQNDKFGKGVHAIWGIKGSKTELQAVRLDRKKFSVDSAKKWLSDHNIKCKAFEPASGKELDEVLEGFKAALDFLTCAVDKLSEVVMELNVEMTEVKDKLEAIAEKGAAPATPPKEGDHNNPPERGNGDGKTIRGEEAIALVTEFTKRAVEDRVRQDVEKMKGKVR